MSKSKYGFSEIIAQDDIKDRLIQEVQQTSLPRAILFTGVEGSGRRTMAMALAKYLLCQNPGLGDACHICSSCRYFEAGSHPDFVELASDDGKVIKVERIRQEVIRDLPHFPQISGRKVYILAGDYLNEQGQNALLKSLEEPPPYAYFLLTAQSKNRLLPTVISRTSEYKLQPLSLNEVKQVLTRHGYSEGIDFIAAYSGHIPGVALNLVAREDYRDLREEFWKLLSSLSQKDFLDLAKHDHRFLLDNKDNFLDILTICQSYLRDLGIVTLASGSSEDMPNLIINMDKEQDIIKLSGKILGGQTDAESKAQVITKINRAETALREYREALTYNVNYEILAWNFLLSLKEELKPLG